MNDDLRGERVVGSTFGWMSWVGVRISGIEDQFLDLPFVLHSICTVRRPAPGMLLTSLILEPSHCPKWNTLLVMGNDEGNLYNPCLFSYMFAAASCLVWRYTLPRREAVKTIRSRHSLLKKNTSSGDAL